MVDAIMPPSLTVANDDVGDEAEREYDGQDDAGSASASAEYHLLLPDDDDAERGITGNNRRRPPPPMRPALDDPGDPLLPQRQHSSDDDGHDGGDGRSDGGVSDDSPVAVEAVVDWAQALALSSFLSLLLSGWLLAKFICFGGLPSDCNAGFESVGAMEDLQMLALYGLSLAWLVGMLSPKRRGYVFRRGRWWFFVVFYAAIPAWSGLGEIPAFQGSISAGSSGMFISIVVAAVAVVSVVGWHLWYTWTKLTRADAALYTITRLAIVAFYTVTVTLAVAPPGSDATVHVHHYLVAYGLATFAAYDHWVSLTMLAVTCGIFVQGLGAYNYASFFQIREHCMYWNDGHGDGTYGGTSFVAFTTRHVNATTGADGLFRLRSCLVDENGRPDLRPADEDPFGRGGILAVADLPTMESSGSCHADLFPRNTCLSASFPGT